jgi:Domain of unknown function (DUF1918)
METTTPKGHVGDVIVVEQHHRGEGRQMCEILEVLDPGGHERYRVRWDDGRESIYFPSTDAHVRRHTSPRPR